MNALTSSYPAVLIGPEQLEEAERMLLIGLHMIRKPPSRTTVHLANLLRPSLNFAIALQR